MVATSRAESFASGRKRRYAGTGIVPAVASAQDASRNARCCSAEYADHSEKFTALRPSRAARAMMNEKGVTRVYHCADIVLEWHSPHERSRTTARPLGAAMLAWSA